MFLFTARAVHLNRKSLYNQDVRKVFESYKVQHPESASNGPGPQGLHHTPRPPHQRLAHYNVRRPEFKNMIF